MKRFAIPVFILVLVTIILLKSMPSRKMVESEPLNDRVPVVSKTAPVPSLSEPVANAPAAVPSPQEIQRLIQRHEADGYQIHNHDGTAHASNSRHRISAQWSTDDGSLRVESLDFKQPWHFSMQARGAVASHEVDDETLTFRRDGMDEWFTNDARGIEHGFHVPEPPSHRTDEGFRVVMDLSTSLSPELCENGRAVSFVDSTGEAALNYRGLLVLDATGRPLPAALEVADGEDTGTWELAIHVEDRDAVYPLMIDPFLTTKNDDLISISPEASELFGFTLSMSGNLLAVGIPRFDSAAGDDSGAVDLFEFNEVVQAWTHLKRLFPANPTFEGFFGFALELDGDTLIVGAPEESPSGLQSGAAYLFERDLGGIDNWGLALELNPADGEESARFGSSVALDGGVAAVGAPGFSAGGVSGTGALYALFRDNSGVWSAPEQVTGYSPTINNAYGGAVSVSGTTIAASALFGETVGTPDNVGIVIIHEFILDDDGLPVSHSTETIADINPSTFARFGTALDLEGDTLVVGSPFKDTFAGDDAGEVSIFRRSVMGNWQWSAALQAPDAEAFSNFGQSLSLSGDTLVIGSPLWSPFGINQAGSAYLFESPPGLASDWSFIERLISSPMEAESRYGWSVALSGDAMAIGSPYDNLTAGDDAGSVETLVRRSARWQVVRAPEFSYPENTEMGHAVSMDRGRAAVGIPGFQTTGTTSGGVWVLTSALGLEESWGIEANLTSPVPQEGERFGASVAVFEDWLLVGAPGWDEPGAVDAGRAYLFRRTEAAGWAFHKTLDVPGLPAGAEYGTAVAMNSRWAFVGAPGMNFGYVFDRYEGGSDFWDISTIIDESAEGGRFGSAVTVDGNYAAFSAPERNGFSPAVKGGVVISAGQVKVYRPSLLPAGVVWTENQTLPIPEPDGSFGAANADFGASLSLHRGVLLVGEPGHASDAGRARLFAVNEGGSANWGEVATFAAPNSAPGERFGSASGMGSRWFFVGASGRLRSGVATGAVFTYDRHEVGQPGDLEPASTLFHPRGALGDRFGASLSFSDNELIVGLPGARNSSDNADVGNYAVFHRQTAAWAQLGSAAGAIASTGDQLGYSVAVDGDFLVAGAPFDSVSGNLSAGSAHLYRRNPSTANGWSFVKLLLAGDVQVGANFGYSVDIQADTIVIGAPGWDSRGAAYVFSRNTGGADNWGQRRRIDLAGVLNGDDFGEAVSVDEDLIVVGAPADNTVAGFDTGRVYVFERNEGGANNWGYLDDFGKPAAAPFDFFGSAVDHRDGGILVGAPLSDETGDASGGVFFFKRAPGAASWSLYDTFPPSAGLNDRIGGSVALDRGIAIAGGIGDSDGATNTGAAWVFIDNFGDGSNWTREKKMRPVEFENPSNLENLFFGSAVSVKGDQVAVGATGYDEGASFNIGAAFVFERNQSVRRGWGLVRKLVGQGTGAGDQMGAAIAMTDDLIVAGAPEADQGGQVDAGYLFFFGDIGSANESWARARFGDADVDNAALEDSLWGPNADPDNDGRVNAVEAFMATDPQLAESPGAVSEILRDDAGDLVFRYRKGKETQGAEGRVTWSRDMSEWRGGERPSDEFEIATRVVSDHHDHFMMEARISADQLVSEPRLFMRLEVNVP
ncbi:hypothetical protein [Haloferula sp.]|uniref:FG-GAP repeat protein n=1 Tax=Haloferula sp. TaxID=2497595 RepID=UPI003C743F45